MFPRRPALFATLSALLFAAALSVATPAEAAGKLNVNTASAADLAKVPGLDAQIAVRIVARRAAKPFRTLDELLEVQGISKLTMISAAEYLEAAPAAAPAPPPAAPAASGKKLDLNKATFSELLLLPEMTPRTAKAIVDYRERNRGFKTVDELAQVPGIEKRAMITLYDRLTVKAPAGGGGEIVLGEDGWSGTAVAKAQTPTPAPAATPPPRALTMGEKIDINSASREELERLPDIGPVMAQRILDHRRSKGAFDTVEELLDVRGIGQNRLTSLRPWVTVGGGSRTTEIRPTPERTAATPRATPVRTAVAASTPRPVPTEKPVATPAPTRLAMVSSPKPAITPDGRVNINVAGVDDLLTLPRMTKAVAQEIVEYRSKNGPFRDPHAIVDVPSIGEAAYARLRDKIAAE